MEFKDKLSNTIAGIALIVSIVALYTSILYEKSELQISSHMLSFNAENSITYDLVFANTGTESIAITRVWGVNSSSKKFDNSLSQIDLINPFVVKAGDIVLKRITHSKHFDQFSEMFYSGIQVSITEANGNHSYNEILLNTPEPSNWHKMAETSKGGTVILPAKFGAVLIPKS